MTLAIIHLALAIPWLNPFTFGPSPAVAPWLVCATCALVLVLVWLFDGLSGQARRDWPKLMAINWLTAALISAGIGLCQYFGVAAAFAPLMNIAPVGEAFANLRQRNQFASLIAIGLAALLWCAPSMRRVAVAGAIIFLAFGSAASASRTGFLHLLMLTALSAIWPAPQRVPRVGWCLTAVVVYLFASWVLPVLAESLTNVAPASVWARLGADDGCGSRAVLWSNVVHLISLRPWFGWGVGELDFAHYVTLYPGARFCDILDNAHNLPLQLAVEWGVPAAVLLCGGLLFWVVRQRPWAETEPTKLLAWSVLAIILLHSMLEYPLWYGPFQLAAFMCVVLLRTGRHTTVNADLTAPRFRAKAGVAGVVVGAVMLAYSSWDYWRISQIYLPAERRSVYYRDDTLAKLQASWLFADQVRFAQLTTAPLSGANAAEMVSLAQDLLHYSPEPRVVEVLIEGLSLLNRTDEAIWHLARYRAAFPEEYRSWARTNRAPSSVPQ